MRITKLHLLLFVAVIACAGFFAYQYQQEKQRQIAVVEEQKRKAQEEARIRIELAQKKESATKAVAVAGACWTQCRQEGKDIAVGQQTLHNAKEALALEKFVEAEALARQSIEELEAAKLLIVKYTVKHGDNLWKIAKMKKHYGRGSMWPVIWRANEKKVPDFDVLRSRLVLVIPKTDSEIKKYIRRSKI